MKQPMTVLTSSSTAEWYTPPYIVEMAREVMGKIHLDPASHAIPQKWINADIFYSKEENGLNHKWHGNVWLNPPYGKIGRQSSQGAWAQYLLNEYREERVSHAILLTKTVPGYAWWDHMFHGYWPGLVCISKGRIEFVASDGETRGKSKSASSFWHLSPHPSDSRKFRDVFSKMGRIIEI